MWPSVTSLHLFSLFWQQFSCVQLIFFYPNGTVHLSHARKGGSTLEHKMSLWFCIASNRPRDSGRDNFSVPEIFANVADLYWEYWQEIFISADIFECQSQQIYWSGLVKVVCIFILRNFDHPKIYISKFRWLYFQWLFFTKKLRTSISACNFRIGSVQFSFKNFPLILSSQQIQQSKLKMVNLQWHSGLSDWSWNESNRPRLIRKQTKCPIKLLRFDCSEHWFLTSFSVIVHRRDRPKGSKH